MVDTADSADTRDAQLAGDLANAASDRAPDSASDGTADPAAEFLDTVLDGLTDGVLACSRSGVPIVVNRAARVFYEAVAGTPWDDHAGRAWLDRLVAAAAAQAGPHSRVTDALAEAEVTLPSVTGPDRTVLVTTTPVISGDGPALGSVVALHDVTEQRAERRRLAREATHDPVTGLPTRPLVMRRVEASLAHPEARPVGVLYVDVDRMRSVNDRVGYQAGDRLLAAIARDLVAALRKDGWVGHLGGDQFVVIVTGPPPYGYDEIAARVQEAVSRPRLVKDGPDGTTDVEVAVTASVGVAVSGDGSGGAPALVHDAEVAMRYAQGLGTGQVATFVADMRASAAERELADAVRAGELVVHYQPKVDLASDRLNGVEALVRWDKPGHGMVPPDDFIPLAEATGVIVELGAWVLRQACADLARWHETFPERQLLRVCVNVSPRQFEAGVVEVVQDVLAATGVPAKALCLEVTETAVMRDVDAATRTLGALRDLGVMVSIDDFGTGYSSLAYLRRFPVDELKIDKTFIDGLGTDRADTALVGGIVSLAHALELTVVAEGVETAIQLDALRRIGCEVGQGYYFSRPQPAAAIDAVLRDEEALRRERPARDEPGTVAALEDETVVIADDADDVRMLARMSLTTAGFDVHDAPDGRAALDLVRAVRPGCVVLDVAMPGLDGLAVCREIRAEAAIADCTIVMLTATDTASDKIAAFAAGADDYIVKPFSPRDLVGRLRAAHRRRRISARPAPEPVL